MLPKDLHEAPQSPRPIQSDEGKEEAGFEEKESGDHTGDPLILEMEIEEAEDEGDLEEVEVPVISAGHSMGAPKTMRELAEDAERQRSLTADKGDKEVEILSTSPTQTAPSQVSVSPANGRQTRKSGRFRTAPTASSSPNTKPVKTGTPKVTLKLPQANTPRRTRKRARDVSDSDASHGSDVESEVEVAAPTPKRARKSTGRGNAAAAVVPKSDRVLRSRAPKSAAQLQEEREQEEAYRRAIQ